MNVKREFPVTFELGEARYTVHDYAWKGPMIAGRQFPTYSDLRALIVVSAATLIEGLGERVKSIQLTGGNPLEMLGRLKPQLDEKGLDAGALQPVAMLQSLFAFNPAQMIGGAMFAGGKGVRELIQFFETAEIKGVKVADALMSTATRYPSGSQTGAILNTDEAIEKAFKGNDGEYYALLVSLVSIHFGGVLQIPFAGVAALWNLSDQGSDPSATTKAN